MTDRLQGDPLLIMTEDGVNMEFKAGQPTMTQGFSNQANISLFTLEGWPFNPLLGNENNQIGSDFVPVTQGPITITTLSDAEKSANKALASEAFGSVETTVSNPTSQRLDVSILIKPPGSDIQELTVSRNGLNWLAQALE